MATQRKTVTSRSSACAFIFLLASLTSINAVHCANTSTNLAPAKTALHTSDVIAQNAISTTKRTISAHFPSVNLQLTYPEFVGLPLEKQAGLNASLKNFVENKLAEQDWSSIKSDGTSWKIDGTYEVRHIGTRFISVCFYFNNYFGGSNGIVDNVAFNYDLENEKVLSLNDFVGRRVDYNLLADLCRLNLFRNLTVGEESMIIDGTEPVADNYTCWLINDNGITFKFGQYQVAPYEAGMPEVKLSFDELKPTLSSAAPATEGLQKTASTWSRLTEPAYRKTQLEIAVECFNAKHAQSLNQN